MKIILYGSLLFYSVTQIWLDGNVSSNYDLSKIVIISLIVGISLLTKEKFLNNRYFSIFNYIMIIIIVYLYHYFYGLLAIITFDMIYKKYYLFLFIYLINSMVYIFQNHLYDLLFILIFSSVSGFLLNKNFIQQKHYFDSIDNERKLRYELENIKIQLIQNNKEIERITEIKERNRIARDLHDNIGHDIAGILIQLQAAEKIFNRDSEKTLKIISLCITKLSQALDVVRNTVYNIKPVRELNENIFKEIIDKFIFCQIEYQFVGDFMVIKSEVLEVLITNLKETLTNASKYSGASNIEIKIEANKSFLRFFYKDNGKGCKNIKEGIGISGMKERIKNVGGVINIDGSDGFSIISIIPNIKTNIFQSNG